MQKIKRFINRKMFKIGTRPVIKPQGMSVITRETILKYYLAEKYATINPNRKNS